MWGQMESCIRLQEVFPPSQYSIGGSMRISHVGSDGELYKAPRGVSS